MEADRLNPNSSGKICLATHDYTVITGCLYPLVYGSKKEKNFQSLWECKADM